MPLYVTSPLGCHVRMGKLQTDISIQHFKCYITEHIKNGPNETLCYVVIKQQQRDVTYHRLTQLCDLQIPFQNVFKTRKPYLYSTFALYRGNQSALYKVKKGIRITQ